MLYEVQDKTIWGKWETLALTTCFRIAIAFTEPRGRIIDYKTRRSIAAKDHYGKLVLEG